MYIRSLSNFKFKKLLNIWIEVLFYSLIIYSTLIFTNKIEFGYKALLKSFFPILLRNYWFVSVYVILYILSPFINKLIHSLNKKQYSYLVLIVFIFFSLWSTIIPPANTINYGGSYSISWFICLYLIAGYLKRFYSDKKIKKSICLCVYFIASLLNVIAYFGIKKLNIEFILPDFLYNKNILNRWYPWGNVTIYSNNNNTVLQNLPLSDSGLCRAVSERRKAQAADSMPASFCEGGMVKCFLFRR